MVTKVWNSFCNSEFMCFLTLSEGAVEGFFERVFQGFADRWQILRLESLVLTLTAVAQFFLCVSTALS